ncbi:MAG: DUF1206 domain-containing protein [Acidimicrobiales bacterium]
MVELPTSSAPTRVPQKIDSAVDDDTVEAAGRAGLTARGVIHLISALLTGRIALLGSSEEGPGKIGALRTVADQPFGKVMLSIVALGLAGYAFWRFMSAITYSGGADEGALKVWAKRLSYVGRGIVYGVALVTALSLIFGVGSAGSGSGDGQSVQGLFALPLGRWIVLAIGLGFLAAAGHNLYRALADDVSENWSHELRGRNLGLANGVAAVGLAGHMAVFALVGFFITKAAVEYDPNEPQSLDQAVRELVDAPAGTWILALVAVGMVAYAGFSFIEARYRRVVEG